MSIWLQADHPDAAAHAAAVLAHWPAAAPRPVVLRSLQDMDSTPSPRVLLACTSRGHTSALLPEFARRWPGTRCFAVQDYWGDLLPSGGPEVETYLVRDETAAARTAPAPAVTTGCARYAGLEAHDVLAARRAVRAACDPQGHALVLWLGQAPQAAAAYAETMQAVAGVLAARRLRLLYRPHARESEAQVQATRDVFGDAGVDLRIAPDGELWPLLAAADAVLGCFSQALVEAAYLNRASPQPLNRSIFVMTDARLRDYHRLHDGEEVPPFARSGLALFAGSPVELAAALEASLDAQALSSFWQGALRRLVPGSTAAATIAAQLLAA